MHCDHSIKFPETFNSPRYLGIPRDPTDKSNFLQQDFVYLDNYRIDFLHKSPQTRFTLTEKTVVRIEGLEHEHLDFTLKITKDKKTVASY